ncbi:calcium transporting ATPase [Flagelloscypha sp. PMI_526]|nr:calcium transporting ATPase [Flagelloscypha sp. PMI_526]
MADDFLKLVSTANPAAQQYQNVGSGYPPSTSSQLDPFFDDDEPDSAFGMGRPPNNASQASDLPLARHAAPPAGGPQGWSFDDPLKPIESDIPFNGSGEFHGSPSNTPRSTTPRPKRRWKFPWQKEKQVVGERVIALNNVQANVDFISNYVSTSKYNTLTFLPKFLLEQFSKYANLFFLFTACIQQIPGVSPTNQYTTIVPLGFVLMASAFKEVQEDLKRHRSDSELNSRKAKVLTLNNTFEERKWENIMVGEVVRCESNDFIPADLVLIASSEPEGLAYIETANLDGETNLKIKQASPQTAVFYITCARDRLYTFEGTLDLVGPGGLPKQLRNTTWMYGLVVYTGHETKLMRNATAAPIKRTLVERQVNLQIVFLFIMLLALSLGSTVGSSIRTWFFSSAQWYLVEGNTVSDRAKGFVEDILTFIILYNNLIPISLIVTMEVVKFQQAQLINYDLDMYYAKTDTPALCRTSSLVEELGQIEYVFSDKTGTLTCNIMEFKCCSIAGVAYAEQVVDSKRDESDDPKGGGGWKTFAEMKNVLGSGSSNPFVEVASTSSSSSHEADVIREFLTLLAVCHTVIPEVKDEKIVYQASSPDEAALVQGAELLGYRFHAKTRNFKFSTFASLTPQRKRMSTVVRMPDGKIKLYIKGADTVILERLGKNQRYVEKTMVHLEDYATEGLRTLCLASREISEQEYRQWATIYDQAAATINGRGEALDQAAELIEKDLFLLGATAIEDKLQDGVPDTIHTLQMAGIKVWVLTGDRQETAINIGMSCRLISESMNLVIVNEESSSETKAFLEKRLTAIKSQRSSGELEDMALIIDGKSLTFALEKDLSKIFLELAIMCKAVVCCRVSPLQKALVVKLVKKNQKSILLAIGDGANDVSMIQAAHVGVGISGEEGLQAARSADVAISQFRYLKKLLLVHGAWSYRRLSKLILFSFYKNIALYMTLFWYSIFNNFSGQIAYESWTLSIYNVIFTVLPPLVIGIFDQFVSARILDRYPQLYILGQKNVFFTKTAFWQWIANAFYHSVIVFAFGVILWWGDLKFSDGLDSGLWPWGTTMYMGMLLTVLGKAALVSDIWTKYTLAFIPGSFVFAMVLMPAYAWLTPIIGFSKEYEGIVPRLWTNWVFYLFILLVPPICLVRDFVWKYYARTYMPSSYHITQELQKYNIPDYRPRQEQFQKAIKKVRAVQRMRRNRGFAFSQTENGKQDQARLIRAYDTSKIQPSGY